MICRMFRWGLRYGFLGAPAIFVGGCQHHNPGAVEARMSDDASWRIAEGNLEELDLSLLAVHDTVLLGAPIVIEVQVRTQGGAKLFRNDPRFFFWTMTGPNGEVLEAVDNGYEPAASGRRPNVYIPAHGVIGFRLNVVCAVPNFVYVVGQVPPPDSVMDQCSWRFPVKMPGRYRIAVKYIFGALYERTGEILTDSIDVIVKTP